MLITPISITVTPLARTVCTAILLSTLVLASTGCGDTQSATSQDELARFLEENPEARTAEKETSNLDSNEYEGVVRTRQRT